MGQTLYERIGGHSAVLAAVGRFYQKVLADETVAPFFQDLDMAAQSKKLVAFMTWAFEGPSEYRGRDLREAHKGLLEKGLNDKHFDAVARHLKATLEELEVAPELVAEALTIVGSTREQVLGR
jgi:hemoglobin